MIGRNTASVFDNAGAARPAVSRKRRLSSVFGILSVAAMLLMGGAGVALAEIPGGEWWNSSAPVSLEPGEHWTLSGERHEQVETTWILIQKGARMTIDGGMLSGAALSFVCEGELIVRNATVDVRSCTVADGDTSRITLDGGRLSVAGAAQIGTLSVRGKENILASDRGLTGRIEGDGALTLQSATPGQTARCEVRELTGATLTVAPDMDVSFIYDKVSGAHIEVRGTVKHVAGGRAASPAIAEQAASYAVQPGGSLVLDERIADSMMHGGNISLAGSAAAPATLDMGSTGVKTASLERVTDKGHAVYKADKLLLNGSSLSFHPSSRLVCNNLIVMNKITLASGEICLTGTGDEPALIDGQGLTLDSKGEGAAAVLRLSGNGGKLPLPVTVFNGSIIVDGGDWYLASPYSFEALLTLGEGGMVDMRDGKLTAGLRGEGGVLRFGGGHMRLLSKTRASLSRLEASGAGEFQLYKGRLDVRKAKIVMNGALATRIDEGTLRLDPEQVEALTAAGGKLTLTGATLDLGETVTLTADMVRRWRSNDRIKSDYLTCRTGNLTLKGESFDFDCRVEADMLTLDNNGSPVTLASGMLEFKGKKGETPRLLGDRLTLDDSQSANRNATAQLLLGGEHATSPGGRLETDIRVVSGVMQVSCEWTQSGSKTLMLEEGGKLSLSSTLAAKVKGEGGSVSLNGGSLHLNDGSALRLSHLSVLLGKFVLEAARLDLSAAAAEMRGTLYTTVNGGGTLRLDVGQIDALTVYEGNIILAGQEQNVATLDFGETATLSSDALATWLGAGTIVDKGHAVYRAGKLSPPAGSKTLALPATSRVSAAH
ncbi:hypothetical protein [uncultured Desulfovibrio sp.]|uniref:hypothetical protein n=1 Tax=uncultured Desulfovibrio sp. TaxID=167968 RepID=UPI002628C3A3|nr:hypothetical protein [uncultured Desulfovibrio sp.]